MSSTNRILQHYRPRELRRWIRLFLFQEGSALRCVCKSETKEKCHCIQGTSHQAMSGIKIGQLPS